MREVRWGIRLAKVACPSQAEKRDSATNLEYFVLAAHTRRGSQAA